MKWKPSEEYLLTIASEHAVQCTKDDDDDDDVFLWYEIYDDVICVMSQLYMMSGYQVTYWCGSTDDIAYYGDDLCHCD